jgi:8-oxo-dGTP diphosphatase
LSRSQPQTGQSDPPPPFGASIAVFKQGQVLLGERGKAPFAGLYSLPGGAIEPGETAAQSALRELFEETGTEAEIVGTLGQMDVAAGRAYRIEVFYGHWRSGEPRPGGDCVAAGWVPIEALPRYRLTEGTAELIRRAAALLGIEYG